MPTKDLEEAAKAAGYGDRRIGPAKKKLKDGGFIRYFSTGSTRKKDLIWHIQALNGLPGEDDPDAVADEPPRVEELPMEFKEETTE